MARSWESKDEPELRLTKRGEYALMVIMLFLIFVGSAVAGGVQFR